MGNNYSHPQKEKFKENIKKKKNIISKTIPKEYVKNRQFFWGYKRKNQYFNSEYFTYPRKFTCI